ncbi:flagellar hook-basal body protein [Gephyromycinifex aptenodytis]|uniref:flagellar hook-basal body protein n=1 Tax=Gephyromycinifex aptenodytis TaxID=2716227 RepID=UPI0014472268|nr:flagellar hook-basal body complex protein [Gephyromycinifex aptenodytis]
MFRAADSAIHGLRQHQTYIDVTANNIANVNSDGFKASRSMFEDTLSQVARGHDITPMPQPNGAVNPAMLGLGVSLRGIEGEFHQGAFKMTNQVTDLAIGGEGYFVLQGQNGPVYTRNGAFTLSADGVLRAGDGKAVLGSDNQPVRVPPGVSGPPTLGINQRGELVMSNGSGSRVLGTIKLARFENQAGLLRVGNTEFQATTASGAAQEGQAGRNGLGQLFSGVVETSNVDMGKELSNLIMAQRGFQASSKLLMTMDELTESVNQVR